MRVLIPRKGPLLPAASCLCSVDSEGGSRLLEEDSEVYKMLQENREARVAPRQSSSFRLLQEALEAEERGTRPCVSRRAATATRAATHARTAGST
uniref:PDZ and LIM domain-containing protein n=1 Tax=Ursus americanus TaxID=9643 RepID=A0A452SJB0_URSAM